jgi:DNA modification methylase
MTNWPADKVERRALKTLIPYAKNARTHSTEQVAQIAASMKEWGWTNPVLVDEGGEIIAGHGRVLAAGQLGFSDVPVMVAEGWSEAQKRAYALADNQLALNAGWDFDTLADELRGLKDWEFDLSLLGFSDLDALLARDGNAGLTDPDDVPPVPATAISRTGDLWQLGNHRLLCGDSLAPEQVARLMAGERAALFATDPPYAVEYTGGVHPVTRGTRRRASRDKDWSAIYHEADNLRGHDPAVFYERFVAVAIEQALLPNAAWYCWHASKQIGLLLAAWTKHEVHLHQEIVWVKSRPVLTRANYLWQHEPCLHGWRRPHKPPGSTYRTDFTTTVWQVPNHESESRNHPTCKPIRLFTVPMEVHTERGSLCYEAFSGSGSQIMAAETMGRRCYAMEIEPTFVDVAVERWQAFTGETATLEDDGRTFATIATERQVKAA